MAMWCARRRGARRGSPPRVERGAAAVEAALLLGAVLAPLMVGVLYYGLFFWKLQSVPTLDPNLDQSGFVGSYCATQRTQLADRVRAATLVSVQNVDEGSGLPISLEDIVVTVLDYVPGSLGVSVQVSITAPVLEETLSFLPLPDDGNVVSDSVVRLENVMISSESC
ncbi:hypothetical protein H5V45_04385 [Nocardioides sp. KIGAM211]|uniref:Uncharacterized protein n=1 Tax=Nocardioides luti TaxID=2761101 RepID=A0A7X0RDY5_9ACTN|nr:hypothetical protein [Nocardioides luti]MBB6626557.1 hypothetical protein [Nocardioides luti]